MAAQENVALARSLIDLYNDRQSDPAWLDKSLVAFAADAESLDAPSGATLRGPDGYKRLMLFFKEALPDCREEVTNAFATGDQVVLESSVRGANTGSRNLATGAIPAWGRSIELRVCHVFQIRNGKIVSHHTYYDMTTLLEQFDLAPATG